MKIGIICAVEREAAPFLHLLDNPKITEKAMLKFHQGKISGKDVVLVMSGVCKVNAAIAAELLIDRFQVDAIINAGTAGAISEEPDILDTIVSTEVAYHDVAGEILIQNHPKMDSVFFKADERLISVAKTLKTDGKLFFGTMVTGEKFIADEGRERIIRKFAPLSVDMETGAIAHVCHVNRVPFIALRTITDTAAKSGLGYFEENVEKAAAIAASLTADLIKAI